MRKKIIFIAVFIILCLGFVAGIQIIKNKQNGSEKENGDSFVTGKTFFFEELLKEAKISSVREIGVGVPSSNQKASFLNYFFTENEKIQEIQSILSEYEYMESSVNPSTSLIALWSLDYEQSDDRILNIAVYPAEQPDLVQIIFSLKNLGARIETQSGWKEDYSLKGFFVDSKISDEILKIIFDSKYLSSEYIAACLENSSELPSMTDFFQFRHEWKDRSINNSTGELYDRYIFDLSDTEDYALLYCVQLTISGDKNRRWRSVFKIEFYNSSGQLTETLYDNQEGYENLIAEINATREE